MKSAIIALIKVQGLSDTVTTQETTNHIIQRDAQSNLESTLHEFEDHLGYACRGSNGKHDNSEEYYNTIQASPDECRLNCDSQDWCTGYEVSSEDRCELWAKPIGVHLEAKPAASCFVKETLESDQEYELIRGHGCRGIQGSHDTKAHYYEYKRLSALECRNECNEHDWCTGYETGLNKKCELWKESIGNHLKQERGLSCYVKVSAGEVDHCQVGKVKSITGSERLDITFENYSQRSAQISWINYDHVSVKFNTLNYMESLTQMSYESQPWLLTSEDDQILLEDFIVGENTCAENKRSRSSDHPSEFQIHNSGSQLMDLYWLNYEGESIHYYTLEPETDVKFHTAATHPWYITLGGKPAVQWTVGVSTFHLTTDGQEEFKVALQ